ncbi:endonuclease/exonuclease/phosphatase family protein [Actinomadura namibiensis]|uniref:Endonuclease/exonuclease/phosphatase family metal-dependent hydrolase n=1 Tax=Actinomadura namibiensis TaxID=182080 RepID=A0A7W3LPX7_ACTNM|nr:endonuclease/exonuclease/phosphatase family protein [Actinomadura namibiensis]MBA8952020.1 endonuclease/exonuclease/phosphatase family metal-dependent hydrolase [Actinomadura namibiensis]
MRGKRNGHGRRGATVLVWIMVLPFAAWAVLRWTGYEPGFRWRQLVAFTPYVAAAAPVVLVAALALRRWPAAVVAGAVSVALAAAVLPRAVADDSPGARGPALRVLAANLLYGQVPTKSVMDLLRRTGPDVLTLQELTPQALADLRNAGVDALFPHRVLHARHGAGGSGIYSRYPLRGRGPIDIGFLQARAEVLVPKAPPVEVVSVHPCAPAVPASADCWRKGLAALPGAEPRGRPRILAGDFNATLDHAYLRRLLDTGYRDAADAAGEGLRGTWPNIGKYSRTTPRVTLDHVLVDPRVAVHDFTTHTLPKTDHSPVQADLVLPAR